MDYLEAAEQTGEWLLATALRDKNGWSWPFQPDVAVDNVGPSLGWGTAAPTMFFVEAYRTTGTERWLSAAHEGARWMANNFEEHADGWAGCGLFTGVGGWALVLDELARAGDNSAHDIAGQVFDAVVARVTEHDDGVQWHGYTEILWGTAGIGCLLLSIGSDYLGNRAIDLASRAGDWLIAQAEVSGAGMRWSLGPGIADRAPLAAKRFPNFAHGAAGIGFFLARLTEVTGEQRFLRAARRASDWILSTARTDDDTCAAFHHEPDGTGEFTLGWCHGPPGLGWFFRQLELTDRDPQWRAWLRRAARADTTSDIPKQVKPGYWDNVARCCGSAGVAEFFLDLHTLEGREDDLAFGTLIVKDLLDRAIIDDTGMRWSNYEFRAEDPNLPPDTTYLQGAPGIGSTLLRMHRHLNGDAWTVNWPHAPRWR
jgi:hypothetical protein